MFHATSQYTAARCLFVFRLIRETDGFSLARNSPNRLGWSASEPRHAPVSVSSTLGLQVGLGLQPHRNLQTGSADFTPQSLAMEQLSWKTRNKSQKLLASFGTRILVSASSEQNSARYKC